MLANQKMVALDGYEIALFPFEYLYMSQLEGGNFSHINTYIIDFLGWDANGRVLQCPFYAPCTLECVDIWDSSSNNRVYQSVHKVHLADGTLDYLTIAFAHDDNPVHNVGDIIQQGALLGHTGTTGQVTGDHTHTCCGKGVYQGYTQRAGGHYDLTNRIHYWQGVYVNDTDIVQGYTYDWTTYNGRIRPEYYNKNSTFPWVLYARKIREKNTYHK